MSYLNGVGANETRILQARSVPCRNTAAIEFNNYLLSMQYYIIAPPWRSNVTLDAKFLGYGRNQQQLRKFTDHMNLIQIQELPQQVPANFEIQLKLE